MTMRFGYMACEELREIYRQLAVPIVPKDGLYLIRYVGDGARCARRIRETWKLLPLSVRRTLLSFWQEGGLLNMVCPEFELAACGEHWRDEETLGMCGLAGHAIRLWAPAMDCLPPFVIREVVAHELGHAYLWATGVTSPRTPEEKREYDEFGLAYLFNKDELKVHSLVDQWGFNVGKVDRWLVAHQAELKRATDATFARYEAEAVKRLRASKASRRRGKRPAGQTKENC